MTGSDRAWAASRDFLIIHLDLLDVLDGSYAAAAVWSRIHYRAGADGWWTATREQMCTETRLTERVLRRALEELRAIGLVEAARVSPFDPTLRWRIVWDRPDARDEHLLTDGQNVTPVMDESSNSVSDDSSITSSQNVRTPPMPPDGGDAELFAPPAAPAVEPAGGEHPGFAEWYALYPRKTGRKAAVRAYAKAAAEVGPDRLLAGLRRQLPQLLDTKARDPQFVKHPASWLNAGSWDDEVASVTPIRRDAVPDYRAPVTDEWDPSVLKQLPPPRTSPW